MKRRSPRAPIREAQRKHPKPKHIEPCLQPQGFGYRLATPLSGRSPAPVEASALSPADLAESLQALRQKELAEDQARKEVPKGFFSTGQRKLLAPMISPIGRAFQLAVEAAEQACTVGLASRQAWASQKEEALRKMHLARQMTGVGVALQALGLGQLMLPLVQSLPFGLATLWCGGFLLGLASMVGLLVGAQRDLILSEAGHQQLQEGPSESAWRAGQRSWFASHLEVARDRARVKELQLTWGTMGVLFPLFFAFAGAVAKNVAHPPLGETVMALVMAWGGMAWAWKQSGAWAKQLTQASWLGLALAEPYRLQHPQGDWQSPQGETHLGLVAMLGMAKQAWFEKGPTAASEGH